MISLLLPDTKILLYDDAMDMPAALYKEFQKYLLQDAGIGSTMDDIITRYDAMFKHLAANKYTEAKTEAENLYYTSFAILEKLSYKHLSFGCLIHSVNDQVITDHSSNNLSDLIDGLSKKGLTQKMVEDAVLDSKKNSNPN
jgi:hypothetical protein